MKNSIIIKFYAIVIFSFFLILSNLFSMLNPSYSYWPFVQDYTMFGTVYPLKSGVWKSFLTYDGVEYFDISSYTHWGTEDKLIKSLPSKKFQLNNNVAEVSRLISEGLTRDNKFKKIFLNKYNDPKILIFRFRGNELYKFISLNPSTFENEVLEYCLYLKSGQRC